MNFHVGFVILLAHFPVHLHQSFSNTKHSLFFQLLVSRGQENCTQHYSSGLSSVLCKK